MNIKSFKHKDWTKIYEGRWSFLTSTHFVDQYTKEIIFGGKPFKSQSIIFVSHGRSSGWMRQKDKDRLGKFLSEQIIKKPRLVSVITNQLKNEAKSFLSFIAKNEKKSPTIKLYSEFWERLLAYYKPHINVKYVVDYLRPDLLKKYLPILEAARLTAEPVLNRTEDFMINFAKNLSKKTKYPYELLLCLTKEELKIYFEKDLIPKITKLKLRHHKAALLGDKKGYIIFTDKSINKIEQLTKANFSTSKIKGMSAYKGKVTGRAKIIFDPKKSADFKIGDILISGSTRPEFLPLMQKASAFVTDAGGILSHAAITAREMKKPCVIGTKNATKVFKDGDILEVDANKGIVKKIK